MLKRLLSVTARLRASFERPEPDGFYHVSMSFADYRTLREDPLFARLADYSFQLAEYSPINPADFSRAVRQAPYDMTVGGVRIAPAHVCPEGMVAVKRGQYEYMSMPL